MADVQEILKEMENLDKEVVTADKSEQDLAELVTAAPAAVGPTVFCETPVRTVSLCCSTVVKHFNVSLGGKTLKLIYDTSCLHATIEPCTVTVCGTGIGTHVVKVVGYIPFAFSAQDALNGPGICGNFPAATTPKTADLCAQCCICVNNPICCYLDVAGAINPNALTALNNLESDLGDCANVTISTAPSVNVFSGTCSEELIVRFTATLTLPGCRV